MAVMQPAGPSAKLSDLSRESQIQSSKFFYSGAKQSAQPSNVAELISFVQNSSSCGVQGVCVVENPSPTVWKALRDAWSLEDDFFTEYTSNGQIADLWRPLREPKISTKPKWQSLEGIYQYHGMNLTIQTLRKQNSNYCERHVLREAPWPIMSTTRMAYCRVSPLLYLFFVDAPISYKSVLKDISPTAHTGLRFSYARNRGGVLLLPLPSEDICNLFNVLSSLFEHKWMLEFFFKPDITFPKIPLLYLMAFFLLESNLRLLDSSIKHISFHSIREPGLFITDELHDLRKNLSELRTVAAQILDYTHINIRHYFESLCQDLFHPPDIITRIEDIAKRAADLHSFYIETFQLLVNTISIRDSQYSIRQAEESLQQTRQATLLTWLAAIYLPLSVATGLFGMNIQEINGSIPRWWMFFITYLGLLVVTFIPMLALPFLKSKLFPTQVQPVQLHTPRQDGV